MPQHLPTVFNIIEGKRLLSNSEQRFLQVPSSASSSRSARVGALGSEYTEDWLSWVSFEMLLIAMLPKGMVCSRETLAKRKKPCYHDHHKDFCLSNLSPTVVWSQGWGIWQKGRKRISGLTMCPRATTFHAKKKKAMSHGWRDLHSIYYGRVLKEFKKGKLKKTWKSGLGTLFEEQRT